MRRAIDEWLTQDDLEDVDLDGYGRVMERQAEILRTYCADVLRGDWGIYGAAHSWLENQPLG